MTIPVSVIVTTKNEAARIASCLAHLSRFSEIVVVDSQSMDGTVDLANAAGATVISYQWNGQYPKKRQWCLDTLVLKSNWVFFVDADEVVTTELSDEIEALFAKGEPDCAGYFIQGLYVISGKTLRHGLRNAKLALLDRRRLAFPVVDDIGLPGMGEIEGHYQPVLRPGQRGRIGRLKAPLLHEAYDNAEAWEARHRRYAAWEKGMNERNAWPADPVAWRQTLKRIFRAMPFRPLVAFIHCYLWKKGFLDGYAGFRLAWDRYKYYRMISRA